MGDGSSDLGKARRTRRRASSSDADLAGALAARFAASLLPHEQDEISPGRIADAARFALGVLGQRAGCEPSIAVASVGGGAGQRFMRVAIVNDDMPFLVDSAAAAVAAHGLAIAWLAHPVVGARRDPAGRLTALDEPDRADGEGELRRESVIYLEPERAGARQRRALAAALATTLADVRAAVADWPKLKAAMAADADTLDDGEGAALLHWLNGDMITHLGHLVRRRDGSQADLLGICRKSTRTLLSPGSFARAFEWFDDDRGDGAGRASPLIIKANRLSKVHRRVPLDLFIVPVFATGPGGRRTVAALSLHAGVWTSGALAAPPHEIPRLRRDLAELMEQFGFDPAGHAGKGLVHALTALPHDLLIGFARADLERIATTMMSLVDRPRPKLALVRAPLARHLFAFVWLPRDALSIALRKRLEALLADRAAARVLDWSVSVEGSGLALLRFVLDIHDSPTEPDEAALDRELQAMVRGWSAAVEAELAGGDEGTRAAAIAARYAEAFPAPYRATYGATEAARDIRALRALHGVLGQPARGRGARLFARTPAEAAHAASGPRLKLYQLAGALTLSDAVPMLENFGFRVLEDIPTALDGGRLGTIHDFALSLPTGCDASALLDNARPIAAAIAAVLNGEAEDDPFNRLVVAPGLAPAEAGWLRAWYRYLRQAGVSFGIATAVEALRQAPQATRAVLGVFRARHDPGFAGDRDQGAAAADARFREAMGRVTAINNDRLLRLYRSLVDAIVRTNAFAPGGADALAFKLDPHRVPGLPKPLPWREIFVYSRRVEGIHLRAGPVARGGLRWSDRRDDFRTEVLGLMKAQRVKNAVIVPTGAKGGFYPKLLPDPAGGREGWLAEGQASYRTFVRALLSLTDNIVAGNVVHPPGVVVHDGDDPYLVVAADKGTATFSDLANAIADEADFWLDDAFASGGSNGYDHKAMGITARGAWLSVRRHFLEMGIDVQNEPVRVVGVGDMSGDVFGNGMLLSQAIRLVAAFDHRHIFLDPAPDPRESWGERARLFALPGSSWADYDPQRLSPGGGVFARTLKSIPLSREARAMLGLENERIDPDGLIHAILAAEVELLWFGGIGTYVKASHEVHVEVGDPANDAVRVDAGDLRARVIGEGANLGVTQAGRIEFALGGNRGHGGRVNTDFIDNSAGVDCSDHEVNIKIALASARRDGRIAAPARNRLLARMTDEVAAIVLDDNRLQALALSIAHAGGANATPSYTRLIEQLEERGGLDRETEGLADDDVLARRAAEGSGLTRPELAVIASSAKLVLQEAIEASPLPADPGLAEELVAAFPTAMRRKYRGDILTHRLGHRIVATRLANRLVNRMGAIHPFELVEEEGSTLAQVAAAFVAAERLFGMADIWQALDSAAIPERGRLLLFDRAAAALRIHIADLIRVSHGKPAPGRLVAELAPAVRALSGQTGRLLAAEGRAQSARMLSELGRAGASPDEAAMVAKLFDMDGAVGLARLARDSETDPIALTRAFTDLGTRLGLDWAQMTATRMSPTDPWERLLVAGLARDFQQVRLQFLRRARGRAPGEHVERWAQAEAVPIGQFRALVARARLAMPVSPAMLAQLAGQARSLLAR